MSAPVRIARRHEHRLAAFGTMFVFFIFALPALPLGYIGRGLVAAAPAAAGALVDIAILVVVAGS